MRLVPEAEKAMIVHSETREAEGSEDGIGGCAERAVDPGVRGSDWKTEIIAALIQIGRVSQMANSILSSVPKKGRRGSPGGMVIVARHTARHNTGVDCCVCSGVVFVRRCDSGGPGHRRGVVA